MSRKLTQGKYTAQHSPGKAGSDGIVTVSCAACGARSTSINAPSIGLAMTLLAFRNAHNPNCKGTHK